MDEEQFIEYVNAIKMFKVESSNINYIGYDEQHCILKVIFRNNTSYIYHNVPFTVWKQLCLSESKGKFLVEYVVRQSKLYPYKKLNNIGGDKNEQ